MNASEPPFKPSQVRIGIPPLVATMGRSEAEFAAALVVRTLAVKGDTWRPVAWTEIQEVVKADMEGTVDPVTMKRTPRHAAVASLMGMPFYRPDIYEMVKRGFARWTGEPGKTVEFTDKGVTALRKWAQITDDAVLVSRPDAEDIVIERLAALHAQGELDARIVVKQMPNGATTYRIVRADGTVEAF